MLSALFDDLLILHTPLLAGFDVLTWIFRLEQRNSVSHEHWPPSIGTFQHPEVTNTNIFPYISNVYHTSSFGILSFDGIPLTVVRRRAAPKVP